MDARTKGRGCMLLVAALAVQSWGCGTIFYPERRGQRGGRIDAGVAVLDGVGLLFFIIPGVIAFAVDFGDGAIYLPAGKGAFRRVPFDPRGGAAGAARVVERETGRPVALDGAGVRVAALDSRDELAGRFAAASAR